MSERKDIIGPTVFVIVILTFIFASIMYVLERVNVSNAEYTANTASNINKLSNGADIKTNKGDIQIVFFTNEAPVTVANFIKLTEDGFYDGTKFHRVIQDFMIQGGDPNSKGDDRRLYGIGGPGYKFKDEINGVRLERGVLAMANSGADTNGSQFFIMTAHATPWLDGKHTAFAKVVKGMDVVDKISKVAKDERDVPLEPIIVEKIELR